MRNWKKIVVRPTNSILEVLRIIDEGAIQIALVADTEQRLIGTVTDGDVRRGILKGISLDDEVCKIMNSNPIVANAEEEQESILATMKEKGLHHIPLIDGKRTLVGIQTLDELIKPQYKDNWVVLMAGGLGSRLRPLTDDCPKPLLKVGDKPILETILQTFINSGFKHFYLSVNYKAKMIEDYFGNGEKWGVEIRYIYEKQRMGTAGSLGLLPEKPTKPFFIMNGDLLTKVNFEQLLNFHLEHKASATMCVRQYEYQVPYGVVEIQNHRLITIKEKPTKSFFVSAGIYVLSPETLELIPENTYFDMPSLFEELVKRNIETAVFPIREYWLDIGRLEDFQKANGEYKELFK